MGLPVRGNRVAFRRAVFASVALHIALAGIVLVAARLKPDAKPATTPGIDTRVDAVVRFVDNTPSVEVRVPLPESADMGPPLAEEGTWGFPPLVTVVPRTLSAEMLAVISRSVSTRSVASPAAEVRGIHGAMAADRMVVYVLDCSGSMGEFGKLLRARAALLATLRGQPEGVRFQVITYNSTARLLVSGSGCVPATSANIATADDRLRMLEASGRSNHVEAIRLAAQCRPDVILILTDANDLTLTPFRSALAAAGKPITLYVANVSPSTVGTPQALR